MLLRVHEERDYARPRDVNVAHPQTSGRTTNFVVWRLLDLPFLFLSIIDNNDNMPFVSLESIAKCFGFPEGC